MASGSCGHRKRVRAKLEAHGGESFHKYEIMEMLLFLIFKRKDTKTMAKDLVSKFGTLHNIINAGKAEIMSINGMGSSSYSALQIINAFLHAYLKERMIKRKVLECFDDVIEYCKMKMKTLKYEELRIIYLNNANGVVGDEVVQNGTIDMVEVYAREIVRKCIEAGAKSIILVHNHPSGDPTPSSNDILCTKRITDACKMFDICVLDHVIIGGDKYISFRNLLILR